MDNTPNKQVQQKCSTARSIPNSMSIVSWNIHDNRCPQGRKSDLPDFIRTINDFKIFCFQETKGEVHMEGYKCFNKNRKGSRSGGICIGIKRELQEGVSLLRTNDEDFQAVKLSKGFFKLKKDIILVNVYNSPEQSSYKAKGSRSDTTLDVLNLFVSEKSAVAEIILAGDLNSRIGLQADFLMPDRSIESLSIQSGVSFQTQPKIRSSKDKVKNANGQGLIDLVISNALTILNGRTIGDIHGDYTCLKYNGSSVVDYIAISEDLSRHVRSFRCLEFSSLSDHRPIATELRLKIPAVCDAEPPAFLPNPPRFKWSNDQDTKINFVQAQDDEEVKTALLEMNSLDNNVNDAYQLNRAFTNAVITVAKKSLPLTSTKKRTNKNAWFDWDCRLAKRELARQAKRYGYAPNNVEIRSEYYVGRRTYKALIKQKKSAFLADLNLKIENNHALDWKAFKALKKTRQDDDVFDNYDLYNFYKFYRNLYSQKPLDEARINEINEQLTNISQSNQPSPLLDNPIDLTELTEAIGKLKSGKSTSEDLVSAEMLKHLNADFRTALLRLLNTCIDSETYPWNNATMTPLLKKGDKYNPDNYRTICVGSLLGKLYSNIMLQRLQNFREIHCPTPVNQLGFCKGAQTSDHLLTFSTIIDKYCKSKKRVDSLFTCFVDFRKAFDTVCREALLLKIARLGIGGKFLASLRHMYNHSTAQVKLINKLSEVIEILIGTEQGHPMSPDLFKVYIDELTELLDAAEVHVPLLNDIMISHLLWADDLILMALDQPSLQKLIDCLNDFCTSWGLQVNPDKTKIMIFNKSGKAYNSNMRFTLGSLILGHTLSYCYLGIQLQLCGSFTLATEELRKKSLRAYFGLKGTVDISRLSFQAVCNLYDSLIKPIVTYGCPVWLPLSNLFKALGSQVDAKASLKLMASDPMERAHLQFLKWSLGVHKKASNVGSWGDTGRLPIGLTLIKQVLNYVNNLAARGNDGSLVSNAYLEQKKLGLTWYKNITSLTTNLSDQGTVRDPPCPLAIQEAAQADFKRKWCTELKDQTKLKFYRSIKSEFHREEYLKLAWNHRAPLSKIRMSAHNLNCERGRYSRNPDTLAYRRLCPHCCSKNILPFSELPFFEGVIEDEAHALTSCPMYHHLRYTLSGSTKSALMQRNYQDLFNSIESSKEIAPMIALIIAKRKAQKD